MWNLRFHNFLLDKSKKKKKREEKKTQDRRILLHRIKLMTNNSRGIRFYVRLMLTNDPNGERVEERRKKEADRGALETTTTPTDRGDFDESGPCFLWR